MAYEKLTPPTSGAKITVKSDGSLNVPDQPVIPFIEGDGTGRDIWRSSVRVMDAAVQKARSVNRARSAARCTCQARLTKGR